MSAVDSCYPLKAIALAMSLPIGLSACGDTEPPTQPAGQAKETKTKVLEAGANVLQTDTPADLMNIHLVGFHPAKKNPSHQMEAHHLAFHTLGRAMLTATYQM